MFNLKGNRVLITGGSRGIGLSYANAFARQGCKIVINHYKDTKKAREECSRLMAETKATVYDVDMDIGCIGNAEKIINKSIHYLGGLDIVISNAGICDLTPYLDVTYENWMRHMDVNLNGPFLLMQIAAKQMIKQGNGGRIIITTSVGAFRSNRNQTHYCATKGGLNLLAMGMALELGEYGITVNCIAPGWIHTDINDKESRNKENISEWIENHAAIKRLGKPKDHESAVLFLASQEADYMTGSTIFIDGGWNAQL